MTKLLFIGLLILVKSPSHNSESIPFYRDFVSNYWRFDIDINKLSVGDTLQLIKVQKRKGVQFKSNGRLKAWKVNELCGNTSGLEKLFTKSYRRERVGSWWQPDPAHIIIFKSSLFIKLKFLSKDDNTISFIVTDKTRSHYR